MEIHPHKRSGGHGSPSLRFGFSLIRYVSRRLGFFSLRFNRSIWIYGETLAQFEEVLPVLGLIKDDYPQFRLVLMSKHPGTDAWLRTKFVDDEVFPTPKEAGLIIRRFFVRMAPKTILLLGSGVGFGAKALRRTDAEAIPVLVWETKDREGEFPRTILSALASMPYVRLCVRDERTAVRLGEKGMPGDKISVADGAGADAPRCAPGPDGSGAFAPMDSARPAMPRNLETIADTIARSLPSLPDDPPVKQSWRIGTWRDRAGQSRPWKAAASFLMKRRIDDWESLRSRLGRPKSILCLGNGPSSEDPRLKTIEHDCLLRVNWRWKTRGILTDPDIVFIGDPATLHKLPPRIFGIWNVPLEYGMLLRHFMTHGPKLMEYITLERLSPIIRDHDWPARPTNGALMIVTAAALQPERLVIAGMDLFLHPEGKYPGDRQSFNKYSNVHSRDVDLAIIRLALEEYRGDLVILSEPLRQSLEKTNPPAGGPAADSSRIRTVP